MQKKNLFLVIMMLMAMVFSIPSYAQFGQPDSKKNTNNDDFKSQKRLYIGGGLGFGISSYSTSLMVAPVVGYRLSPSFDIGGRFTYAYNRYEDPYTNTKYSFNDFGLGAFARYYLFFFRDLFLHAEYEAINYEYIDSQGGASLDPDKERRWMSGVYLGGGYRQWIGQTAFIDIAVLWNVINDIYVTTNNPIFRIGFGVGL